MAKTNQLLDVAPWANNAYKTRLARDVQKQRKQALERKHAYKVALLIAYFVALTVLYAWLNTIG